MELIQAEKQHAPEVAAIVERTIREIYPKYYPQEVVDYFLGLHDEDRILQDIEKGEVYLLRDEDHFVATGTMERRHLTRIFVLPDRQRKGYGAAVMEFLEQEAGKIYKDVFVESSLPGCIFYEKRDYRTVRHYSIPVENGKVLVYGLMQKKLR